MADQKQKIWNFIGQLKENNNRVVSGVKTSISGTLMQILMEAEF